MVDQRFSFYYPLFSDRKIACDLFLHFTKMASRAPCSLERLFVDLEKLPINIDDTFPANALKSIRIVAKRRSCPVQYFTNSLAAVFSNAMGDSTLKVRNDYIEVPAVWSLNLG